MGRPAKPSVRFTYAKKKRFPYQTVRTCLTYKGRRLFSTDESNIWYGLDLNQFNSDGTLNLSPDNSEKEAYIELSNSLQNDAQLAIMIAEEAEKRGVWEKLTSKDFTDLFGYMSEHRIVMKYKEERGHLTEHERFSEQMYEWRWQQVGKGKE